ncbi:MAG: hypothetical protein AB8F34_09040 [Akkermansiaceae bacterium]
MPPQPPAGIPQAEPNVFDQDQSHLKTLSICYYVMAGLSLVTGLFCSIYVIMGGAMMSGAMTPSGGARHDAEAMQMMGGMFLVIGVICMLMILAMAVFNFLVARRIVERRSRMLCMIVAGINCLNMPMGTVLGVFTFIVLCRPQVAASFDQQSR